LVVSFDMFVKHGEWPHLMTDDRCISNFMSILQGCVFAMALIGSQGIYHCEYK